MSAPLNISSNLEAGGSVRDFFPLPKNDTAGFRSDAGNFISEMNNLPDTDLQNEIIENIESANSTEDTPNYDLKSDLNWLAISQHLCKPSCLCQTDREIDPLDRYYVRTSLFEFDQMMNLCEDKIGKAWYTSLPQVIAEYSVQNINKAVSNLASVLCDTLIGPKVDRPPFFESTQLHELCSAAAIHFSNLNKRFDELAEQTDEFLPNLTLSVSFIYIFSNHVIEKFTFFL